MTHAPLSDIIMVNSWSLLFDELNMTKHSTHYYDYTRNDLDRANPFEGDTLKLDGYSVNGESNQDYWEDDLSLIHISEPTRPY